MRIFSFALAAFIVLPLGAQAQSFFSQPAQKSDMNPLMSRMEAAKPASAPLRGEVAPPKAIKAEPSPVSFQQTIPQLPVQTQETDGPLAVYVDRAEILPLPKNLGSIVIGNPLIADASVHPNGFMVITPKGLGTTNMILLDTKGQTIAYRLIKVKTPSEQMVRVFRGIEKETYNCAPHCDKTQTLGDNNPYFDANLGQSTARTNTLSAISKQQ
jgi:Flp pilus assembly secretin CpaC